MDTDLLRSIRGRLEAATDPDTTSGRRLYDADMARRQLELFEASLPATCGELAELHATVKRLAAAIEVEIGHTRDGLCDIDAKGARLSRVVNRNARAANINLMEHVRLGNVPSRMLCPEARRRFRDQLTWARRPRVSH